MKNIHLQTSENNVNHLHRQEEREKEEVMQGSDVALAITYVPLEKITNIEVIRYADVP